ncbi:MAG: NADH ubiquinone oxidoreductase, 20 kDa subunit [Candidatus Moranbacteria bacterium GW2011_GWF2_36_839]|nr:MAG: NADH ubiquinone oxidoreductase, 20 kDa subunit [Candidatus Moranbacteria bacterium GW2011_GWF1_36_78]KKQ16580.1 MAG: NADH ubiquinone oxidoreductase, 20 kDa subunit [Candidatus Moranbacteria bacterium GW2011_GWF2_36_839]HAT73990.1 formate hydrogenlyase [Candidatus Moranbacteria bacterium]HBY10872.1 formate hydrogenlyase [Candidatus Moranbacteria bacterium]
MKTFKLIKTLLLGKNVTEKKENFFSSDKDDVFEKTGKEIKEFLNTLYGGRSLRIRAVDAGSTNAEEIELTALGNAYYDIDRFGLSFVASPRHADILFVSGPVTRNLEKALLTTYEAVPKPCIVVAVGDGACTGGIWKDSYAVVGPVENVIPVHMKIPGDPPSPTEILTGILRALKYYKAK